MGLKEEVAASLEAVRARTLGLLEPLSDDALARQHSPLMSPLVWDLAHVGNYEDQWLVRELGAAGVGPAYDDMYDAFRHPRAGRPSLPLLGPAAARAYIAEVRDRALEVLDRVRVAEHAFLYGMVVQHEHQHDETMLATLQLMGGYRPKPPDEWLEGPPGGRRAEALVPGGLSSMGTDADPWAYDNERPAFVADVPAFFIDTAPVTNGQYAEFVAEGGYHRPEFWSEAGWKWRMEAGLERPGFWTAEGTRDRFGWVEPVPADEPVQHVCWHEASAYASFVGKRLPTEEEWEKAAQGATRGDVGGAERFGPAPVGSFAGGASVHGCVDMVGGVWEWTASSFEPYPGFRAYPYREYSEVFFGDEYKVLRGGSWATDPAVARVTFRNWDYPIRRQIFAGFRCARDAV
ncbi:MAG TPA: ergothioneine biosynthesis protein EgtB [Acidimicrobiales bacterium]|jgi:iron(II)-dependent oxidoreductase|nr:ergothioneine biosynthesis protein EgtB [Acidimicrobiales bacterium]